MSQVIFFRWLQMILKFSFKVTFHFEMYFYAIFKGIYTINPFKSKF